MKRFIAILCLVWLASTTPGLAQENAGLASFDALAERARSALEHQATSDEAFAQIRKSLEALDKEAGAILAPLVKEKADIESQLTALGPAPENGQAAESAEITEKRKLLETRLTQLDARIKATGLKRVRAGTLITDITNYRRTRFVDRLLYRGPPPSSLAVWEGAWRQTLYIYRRLENDLGSAMKHTGFDGSWKFISSLLAGGFIAFVIGFPIRRILIRKFSRLETIPTPTYSQRIREAVLVGLARSLPVLLAVLVLAASLKTLFLLNEDGLKILTKMVLGVSFFAVGAAFSRTIFAPRRPAWRIPAMSDSSAYDALKWVRWLAVIPAVDFPLNAIGEIYEASRSLVAVHDFLITLLAAIPIVGLTRKHLWQPQPAHQDSGDSAGTPGPQQSPGGARYPLLRFLAAAAAVVAPVIAFFGYSELGFYITTRLVESAVLISFLTLLYLISWDLSLTGLNRSIQSSGEGAASERPALYFWWSLGLGLVFSVLGITGLAMLWGLAQDDLTSWAAKLVTGFEVAGMTFSLIGFVIAVVVFAAIFMITRFVQRMLGNKILPMTRLDRGAQDSLRTMVGYLGFTIAAFAGISAAGFDLTNLAIIAGALSLGIGFGLQNVVNNFVSGLILLVERPIKVGDWVVTASAQGYVKRIKVRATEVETFDTATVIIPNSELISSPVTNWFFRDRGGRVVIPIGVAYDSDAEKVREILLACARDNPRVLRYPGPSAYLVNFGDSALDFSLRFHLGDIDWMMSTASEVRFEILKRFREENIEIPFPQRDIRLRDMDRLEGALKPS